MPSLKPYLPEAIFSVEHGDQRSVPRVLIAPSRYIQGENILDHLGRYLALVPARRAAILISAGGRRRDGERLLRSLHVAGVDAVEVEFEGECSLEEVDRIVGLLKAAVPAVDCVVAVGGGKCVDAGKCVAHRLNRPVVICPSLVSNDAPCSALSVMYTPDGVFSSIEYFPSSPALVAVDTRMVAEAPLRYLVAGMGDAMATWYEARACYENPRGRSTVGARPTLAAGALGELCARTLFSDGVEALDSVRRGEVSEALERVVEANTLLSGIGFESGGLAVAHGVAQGLTVVPSVKKNFLHGEMVAIGLLTQLVAGGSTDEAVSVAEFSASVGLPVHLGQISLAPQDSGHLQAVMETAMTLPYVTNVPFAISADSLLAACLEAHALGIDVSKRTGDAAYRALQNG